MKSINTTLHRETLLITNTSFSKWFWEIQAKGSISSIRTKEQLENACNDGLLEKLLPEIINQPAMGESSIKWLVEIRKRTLRIFDSHSSPDCEKHFTICYQHFLSKCRMN